MSMEFRTIADHWSESWTRIPLLSSAFGTLLWIFLALQRPEKMDVVAYAFLSAPLIVVPLALVLLAAPNREGRHPISWRTAVLLSPLAIALLPLSWTVDPGLQALLFAIPWVLVCTLISIHGFLRLAERGEWPWEEVGVDAGAMLLFIGGLWLAMSRFGWAPIGFAEPLILLTAIHFHFAGLTAPLVAGLVWRTAMFTQKQESSKWNSWHAVTLFLVVGGIPLTALGITISQLGGPAWIERVAAWMLIVGMAGLSIALQRQVLVGQGPRLQRLLHWIAGICLLVSMTAAAIFASSGGATELGQTSLSLDEMRRWHGLVNVGFAITALLGFSLATPPTRGRLAGVPLSGVRAGGLRVGIDCAERLLGSPLNNPSNSQGLVNDFETYRRADFNPEQVDPLLRTFFEKTCDYRLLFKAHWTLLGRIGAPFWSIVSSALNQMRFPKPRDTNVQILTSRIWPLPAPDEVAEWRTESNCQSRLSVRTYDDGSPMYVASYSDPMTPSGAMMRTGLPLPGSTMTALLYVRHPTDDECARDGQPIGSNGLVITSHSKEAPGADQGLWIHRGWFRIRLPLNEQLVLWPSTRGGFPEGLGPEDQTPAPCGWARHTIRLFGFKVLELDYAMQRDVSIINEEG